MLSSRIRRVAAVSILFAAAVACGGAKKPAESAADTASLESSGGGSKPASAAPAAAEDAGSSSGDSSAPSSSPAANSATTDTSAPAGSAHPAPAVTGLIDGKPFTPKIARVTGKPQKDGRVLLTLDETHTDCSGPATAAPGDAVLTMLVTWENGYKSDLGSLKRSTVKKPNGEITFYRARAGGKKDVSPTFKPSGTVTILKAPSEPMATGSMKIDMQSGDYMLAGDLDVLVCPPAPAK
jgi:hypothetical protein